MNVTICLVFGLPAVGKSTLTGRLTDQLKMLHSCAFIYDDLMPKQILFDESSSYQWKEHRMKILNMVDNCICFLKGSPVEDMFKSKAQYCSCIENGGEASGDHVIIIDDNMFYRSMRYVYYQLARKYECSFCQIHLTTSIEILKQRNENRNSIVDGATILKMNDIFEGPDALKYKWEKNSITFDTDIIDKEFVLQEAIRFICECSRDTVKPLVTDEELQEKSESRLKTLENYCHQCDQILRKHISTKMKKAKEQRQSKEELKHFAMELNKKRKEFLVRIRDENSVINDNLILQNEVEKFEEFLGMNKNH